MSSCVYFLVSFYCNNIGRIPDENWSRMFYYFPKLKKAKCAYIVPGRRAVFLFLFLALSNNLFCMLL